MKKYLLFMFLLFFIFSANAFSAVRTWDGGGADANWGTAANWVGDVAPVAGDSLVFPAAAARFTANNNLSTFTFSSVTFEGGNYTIGGGTLSLTNGLTALRGTQTINAQILAGNSQTFTAQQAPSTLVTVFISSLFVAGGLGNQIVLTLDGAGDFRINSINGTGDLTKNGSGLTVLASAGNYTGAITFNNGAFIQNANIPNSRVTINGGEILSSYGINEFLGTGTVGTTNVAAGVISTGSLTVPTGGILNINNNLSFTQNGAYKCKLNGAMNGHDQLNVIGTVSLNNARLVAVPFNFVPEAVGDSFTIIRNYGTDPINGTFLNAPEGSILRGEFNSF